MASHATQSYRVGLVQPGVPWTKFPRQRDKQRLTCSPHSTCQAMYSGEGLICPRCCVDLGKPCTRAPPIYWVWAEAPKWCVMADYRCAKCGSFTYGVAGKSHHLWSYTASSHEQSWLFIPLDHKNIFSMCWDVKKGGKHCAKGPALSSIRKGAISGRACIHLLI